jgi:hypothetical protein
MEKLGGSQLDEARKRIVANLDRALGRITGTSSLRIEDMTSHKT